MVEHLSDDELRKLSRGGHDYRKLFAAYKAAVEHEGTPTVILAKTIKGWTLGPDFEARNATHQIKKMTEEELKTFRDRLFLDIPDEDLEGDAMPPYFHPGIGSAEHDYLMARRRTLDGCLPLRGGRPHGRPPPPDRALADSCSARPPAAPRCRAKVCSTATGRVRCWRRRCRTAAPTTRPSRTRWR